MTASWPLPTEATTVMSLLRDGAGQPLSDEGVIVHEKDAKHAGISRNCAFAVVLAASAIPEFALVSHEGERPHHRSG